MTDKKTIGISSLITLGLISLMMITPTFFDDDNYYCESRGLIEACDSLSGGKGTRCYLTPEADSWLVCSEGWTLISNDLPIQEQEETPINEPVSKSKGVWGTKYTCNQSGCYSE
jgi:hypothetical protein